MKPTLLLCLLLSSFLAKAQINVSESFETSFPAGWTTTGQSNGFTRYNSSYSCDGSWSMQVGIYASNNHAMIVTSNYTSDGNPITVSFQYNRALGAFTGYAYLYYEVNNSGSWVQIASSNNFNSGCKEINGTIATGVAPAGSLVKFRMQINYTTGNTTVFIDNFKAVQEPFAPVYKFDNSYNDTTGANPFSAPNTSFVDDRNGNANSALQIAASTGSTANLLLIPKGNTPRTVSIWYKTTSNAGYPGIFSYGTAGANQTFGLYLGPNGNPIFQSYINDKDFYGNYAANTWQHAVVTYNGSTVKMYMNGTLIGNQAYTLNTGNNSNFKLGNNSTIITVDDLKLYGYALSDAEIAALYAQESLPVELSNFTARLNNKTTSLFWSSATETNTSYFEIEYSNNGTAFVKVGNVKAQGYSNSAKEYSYQHITNNQPIHYYRLKMVDKDGKYAYSNIIKLKDVVKSFEASVYPTIVTNTATLSITSKENANALIIITNLEGKRVMQKNIELIEGSQTIPLNVENLTKGSYIVSIKLKNNLASYTIIKQ